MTTPPALAWRFDARAFATALALFVFLVLLATVGARAGWLRGFFGDVLAVVWLYFVFKTVVAARPMPLALAAFGVGSALELGQVLAQLGHWQVANPVLRVVIGSTPDWLDVVAYGLGAVAAVSIEQRGKHRRVEA